MIDVKGMIDVKQVYERMPKPVQPVLQRVYYTVHPGLSWRKWQKHLETTDEFVEQFFDSRDEYEAYREEFFEGRITDICQQAMQEVDGDERVYDAHQDECAKLFALIRKRRPETIVETGVYSGVSTTAILLALDANGTGSLYSLQPDPQETAGSESDADLGTEGEIDTEAGLDTEDGPGTEDSLGTRGGRGTRSGLGTEAGLGTRGSRGTEAEFYERGRPSCAETNSHEIPEGRPPGWIIPSDLRDRWHFASGRSRSDLPSLLAELGGVDLFLHDSEHSVTGMLFEFELAWEWLRPGGVLLSPHVEWNSAFETFVAERECTHGLASFEPEVYLENPSTYDEPCSVGYAVKPQADSLGVP